MELFDRNLTVEFNGADGGKRTSPAPVVPPMVRAQRQRLDTALGPDGPRSETVAQILTPEILVR